MNEISIEDFVAERGQGNAAKALGISQPALCKALKHKRVIRVCIDEAGGIRAYEIKPVGKKAA